MSDSVNHPSHYTSGDIECIDAIKSALTPDEFRGFCKGNVIKYTWRERTKGDVESLKKAQWYLNRLIHEIQLDKNLETLKKVGETVVTYQRNARDKWLADRLNEDVFGEAGCKNKLTEILAGEDVNLGDVVVKTEKKSLFEQLPNDVQWLSNKWHEAFADKLKESPCSSSELPKRKTTKPTSTIKSRMLKARGIGNLVTVTKAISPITSSSTRASRTGLKSKRRAKNSGRGKRQ